MLRIRSIGAAGDAAPSLSFVGLSFAGLAVVSLLLAVLGGCAGARYVGEPRPPTFALPTAVSASSTLAPSSDPAAELAGLPRHSTPAIELRRAFLELQLGHARAAIDATSQVLYGSNRPSANAESFARYLRAKAYILRGTADLAHYDLDRARELAMDQHLLSLLGSATATPAERPGAMRQLAIEPRSRWHAAAPDRRNLDSMDQVSRVTIHHSAVYFRDDRPAATAAQLQRIQRDHMQRRGFGDIGYHFLVDPAGRVWQGRELRWQGAHASGSNNVRNVGICVLGNFVRGSRGHGPTAPQIDALERLVGALCQDYRVAASKIHRHSDFKATECPGPLLEPVVAKLRRGGDGPRVAVRE